jgi:hypothetical protein
MRYPSYWVKARLTGLTGWLTLRLEGCEKSKVALAMRAGSVWSFEVGAGGWSGLPNPFHTSAL